MSETPVVENYTEASKFFQLIPARPSRPSPSVRKLLTLRRLARSRPTRLLGTRSARGRATTRVICAKAQVDIGVSSDLSSYALACMYLLPALLGSGTQILRTYFLL